MWFSIFCFVIYQFFSSPFCLQKNYEHYDLRKANQMMNISDEDDDIAQYISIYL